MCKVCHGICVFQKSCKVTNLFSYMQIKNEKCNHFVALFTISANFSTLHSSNDLHVAMLSFADFI